MKLAIVHLSDFHLSGKNDVGYKRLEKLANIINFSRSPDEELAFLITGDIANTGAPSEYEAAEVFFGDLFSRCGIAIRATPTAATFIPGNHDCTFKDLGDLRPKLLDEITSQLDNLDENGETVQTLLKVQNEFFRFVERLTGETLSISQRLFRIRSLGAEGAVEVRCFNSAWLSRRHEEPGTLGFPTSVMTSAAEKTDAAIVISIVHHPSNWMNIGVHQAFRKTVQETSDFLITGHEHLEGGQVVVPFTGTQLVHFESGPFQPPNSGSSEFGILHLDLADRSWRHETLHWNAGGYVKIRDSQWSSLADKSERSSSLQPLPEFLSKMKEPGTGFLHPRQPKLSLPDIYVYPNLRTRVVSRKLRAAADLPKNIWSNEVAARVVGTPKLVIAGPGDCGKTALSKMLVLEATTKLAKIPLLLCGKAFSGSDASRAFRLTVEEAIDRSYGKSQRGRFQGSDASTRILIIDDWDKVPFGREGRTAILNEATAHFGSVILFVDDIFLIEELSGKHSASTLDLFEIADIKEFGFHLRGELVRKWHTLGLAFVEDERNLARSIAESTRVIDTVLGRNLLPAFPVYIVTLLQTYDAGAGSRNSGLGSYGQVYEALITARLAEVSIKSIDIGTKITFLSRVAWLLFSEEKRYVSDKDWRSLGEQYYAEYKIRVDDSAFLDSLLEAGILAEDESGFRFTYGYAYCYFVAKYFQENLADLDEGEKRKELFDQLKVLSQKVYKQDDASIIIFYVFLTKDKALILHIIGNAREVFKDVDEFDFDANVGFVNQIIPMLHALQLPESSPQANRAAYDQRRDAAGEQIEPSGDPAVASVIYEPDMPFEQKLIIGIRYLTLMGQILRNFPGSLKADTKLELAFESYSLGLRILGSVFSMAERDSETLIEEVSGVLRNKMAFSGEEHQLRTKAESIISELLREIAYALLKRMSHAIGLKELEATYDDVTSLRDNSLPSRLIQLSIRLDHFDKFPKDEIEALAKELEGNTFSYQTMRDLVINHLYLFPTDYTVQQWTGSLFRERVNKPQIRGNASKLKRKGIGAGSRLDKS